MKNRCSSSSETDSEVEINLELSARSKQCIEQSNSNYPDVLGSTVHPTIKVKNKVKSSGKKRKKTEEPNIQALNIESHPKAGENSNQEETDNILELNSFKFESIDELESRVNEKRNLKCLQLINCSIETANKAPLAIINTLTVIVFINCDDKIFKAFSKQETLQQIEVYSDDKVWIEFPHNIFNEICKNCKNLDHIVLNGAGTTSYMDSNEFPFKIKRLDITAVSNHWYVGLNSRRTGFLETQKESLKHLTIHELPYDFDGGKVLKYIIKEMNLETFYYGKIPLILNGQQQEVKEFKASEIQVSSAIEMIKQFPSIERFILKISNTEISSDHIEKVLDLSGKIFNNLKEFVVIDNSKGSLGIFSGIFRNIESLQKLTMITNNRFINTILKCFTVMPKLEELQLISNAPKAPQRYKTIKHFAPNIKIVKVSEDSVEEARRSFGGIIEVNSNKEENIY